MTETKVILASVLRHIGKAETLKEAYSAVAEMASVEDMNPLPYEDYIKKIESEK